MMYASEQKYYILYNYSLLTIKEFFTQAVLWKKLEKFQKAIRNISKLTINGIKRIIVYLCCRFLCE